MNKRSRFLNPDNLYFCKWFSRYEKKKRRKTCPSFSGPVEKGRVVRPWGAPPPNICIGLMQMDGPCQPLITFLFRRNELTLTTPVIFYGPPPGPVSFLMLTYILKETRRGGAAPTLLRLEPSGLNRPPSRPTDRPPPPPPPDAAPPSAAPGPDK